MAVAAFTLAIMLLAFIRGGIDQIIGQEGSKIAPEQEPDYQALIRATDVDQQLKTDKGNSWTKIRRMVSDPLVLSLMLWSFFYVGEIREAPSTVS